MTSVAIYSTTQFPNKFINMGVERVSPRTLKMSFTAYVVDCGS